MSVDATDGPQTNGHAPVVDTDAPRRRGGQSPAFDRVTIDLLLTTTRSVRRRLDPDRAVDHSVVQECLDLAVQAPNADNRQNWRWLVITDPKKRAVIGEFYRLGWHIHTAGVLGGGRRRRWRKADGGQSERDVASGQWLADNMHRIPVLVLPCVVGRPPEGGDKLLTKIAIAAEWDADVGPALGDVPSTRQGAPARAVGLLRNGLYFGSIYPAVWSFQLALRSRGLGSVFTMTHLPFENEVAAELGIPKVVTQVCLLPVAYTRGLDFQPSTRIPAREVTYWERWGAPDEGGEAAAR